MEDKLKDCPFCSGNVIAIHSARGDWWVTCEMCKAGTRMKKEMSDAVRSWNRRATDQLMEEMVGVLGEAVVNWHFDEEYPYRVEWADKAKKVLQKYQEALLRE